MKGHWKQAGNDATAESLKMPKKFSVTIQLLNVWTNSLNWVTRDMTIKLIAGLSWHGGKSSLAKMGSLFTDTA